MGPRMNCWSLSPLDRYSKTEKKTRRREELSPAQIRDKETKYFLVLETFPTTYAKKGSSGGQKGRELHLTVMSSEINLPIGLFTKIHLG